MARVKDLGTRIELLPEDRYFRDISIALYALHGDQDPEFLVHSYAPYDGTAERIAYVTAEMLRLGGLEKVPGGHSLRFSCGSEHRPALSRLFTRICRRDPDLPAAEFGLTIFDKKADCDIIVSSEGDGRYRIGAAADTPMAERRVGAVRNGLIKLTHMTAPEGSDDLLVFDCGESHDELVALLLTDALNVRAAAREQDAMKSAGVLSAPGRAD